MIRTSFLSLALLGLLFSNVTLAASPQDDIQCKVEQDVVNTALFLEGMLTQSYRACSKGTISDLDIIAAAEFNGGTVSVAIMDANMTLRAIKTFTEDNYNGTSFYLDNLAIPTLRNSTIYVVLKTYDGASCVLPCTDNANDFVGSLKLGNEDAGKNLKFSSSFRGASSSVQSENVTRGETTNDGPSHVQSRVAADIELQVEGDCVSAQRKSSGVLNFNGETLIQTFKACDRGRITNIKLAVPFVEPGYTFDYGLTTQDGTVLSAGTFTHEDMMDDELLLTFNAGAVRANQTVLLKVSCPQGARLAALANGAGDSEFGRLYINGQAALFNLTMAAGLNAATANTVEATTDGRDDIILGTYPVPFGGVLNVAIRGTVAHGAVLQLLDAQGMPVEKRYLSAGSINKPIRLNELDYLRPGLYTIRLVSGENVITKRILKG